MSEMRLRAVLIVVTGAMLSLAASAADVHLSPEVPVVAEIVARPAFGAQRSPSIAVNGDRFFAVWIDDRAGSPILFGAALEPDGSPVPRFGRRIGSRRANTAQIAPLDDGFVIFSEDSQNSYIDWIDHRGESLRPTRVLQGFSNLTRLRTSGRAIAAAFDKGSVHPGPRVAFIDADGDLVAVHTAQSIAGVEAIDGGFLVFAGTQYCNGCSQWLLIHEFRADGMLSGTTTADLQNGWVGTLHATYGGGTILITGRTTGPAWAIVARSGELLDQGTLPASVEDLRALAWDGRQHLATYRTGGGRGVIRLGIAKEPDRIEPESLVNSPVAPAFAHHGGAGIVLQATSTLSSTADIQAATYAAAAPLAQAVGPRVLVSISGEGQLDAQAARTATGDEITVWRTDTQLVAIREKERIVVADIDERWPSKHVVAAGNDDALIAWYDGPSREVRADRVRTDALTVSDEMTLGRDVYSTAIPLEIAFTPDRYLVSWYDGSRAFVAGVDDQPPAPAESWVPREAENTSLGLEDLRFVTGPGSFFTAYKWGAT